jgi:hypothetical protein
VRAWREATLVSLGGVLQRQVLRPSGCDSVFGRRVFACRRCHVLSYQSQSETPDASRHQTIPKDLDALGCRFQLC